MVMLNVEEEMKQRLVEMIYEMIKGPMLELLDEQKEHMHRFVSNTVDFQVSIMDWSTINDTNRALNRLLLDFITILNIALRK